MVCLVKCKSVWLTCQQGPFATFKLQYDRTCEWTGIKFSNDGKLILLSTNGAALRILDAFKGVVLHSFGVRDKRWHVVTTNFHWFVTNNNFCTRILILQGYNNSKGVTLEASFTPDSQFVMIGKNNLSWKKRFLTQNLHDFTLIFLWNGICLRRFLVFLMAILNISLSLRLWGWKDPCVECREWYESSVIRRQTHRTHLLPAVQPQVYDVCKCLFQHGERDSQERL